MDTWDPHEPWDAPSYYTELYMPDYDGELVLPLYGNWHDMPGYREEQLRKGHATYCGEITMVDTWVGFLLKSVENMGLEDRTVVIFTTDHGFYFGEHGGLFGKMSSDKYPDGTLRPYDEPGSQWSYSPLYEEIVHLPLLVRAPGVSPRRLRRLEFGDRRHAHRAGPAGFWTSLTSYRAVHLRPPCATDRSPVASMRSAAYPSPIRAIRSSPWTTSSATSRTLRSRPSLRDSGASSTAPNPGVSQLYNLVSDPHQLDNVIERHMDVAGEMHRLLVEFMRENEVPETAAAAAVGTAYVGAQKSLLPLVGEG